MPYEEADEMPLLMQPSKKKLQELLIDDEYSRAEKKPPKPKKKKGGKKKKKLTGSSKDKLVDVSKAIEKTVETVKDSQRSYTGAGIKDFLLDLYEEEEREANLAKKQQELIKSDHKKQQNRNTEAISSMLSQRNTSQLVNNRLT